LDEFLKELMDCSLQIYEVGTKAHCPLVSLEWSFNRFEPQAPPPYKPSVPQLKALGFWEKNWRLIMVLCTSNMWVIYISSEMIFSMGFMPKK
jgi:hypothetical protein